MSDTPPPLRPESPSQPLPVRNPSVHSGAGSGKKWGIGCGIGCLAMVILVVALAVIGISFGKKLITGWVEKSVSDEPVALVAPEVAPETAEEAIRRFDEFTESLESGAVTGPLELTGDEINAIIAGHPSFSDLSDSIVVSIEDDQLTSEVSINLDLLELPESFFLTEAMAGKYFNGEVSLSLGMVGGRPAMFIEGLSIGGTELPSQWMSEISKENILRDLQTDPELQPFFEKIDEIKIEEGRLFIQPAN